MLSLLGIIFGFLSGMFPKLLELFKDRQDKKHELAILEIQRQMQAQGHVERLEEIGVQADIAESEAMYKYAKTEPLPYTGNKVIDVLLAIANLIIYLLNGLVRPCLAFGFMGLYAWMKHQINLVVQKADIYSPLYNPIALWTETDQAIFCTIVSHYFGQRMMRYAVEKYGKNHK